MGILSHYMNVTYIVQYFSILSSILDASSSNCFIIFILFCLIVEFNVGSPNAGLLFAVLTRVISSTSQ